MKEIAVYLAAVNILGFVIMGIDKSKSKRHKWRISESSIFVVGLLGGGIGVLLGMSFFRHKTKHLKFMLGIPLVIILNIIIFGYVIYKFFI
ncbi:MAG: DUF1294 domain-containing protein [Caulobacteraceae bacterium]